MELQKQDTEGEEGEGRSKYSLEDSQHTLWICQVSLSAESGVIERKTMELK